MLFRSRLRGRTIAVGVFVNEPLASLSEIVRTSGVKMVQFHGEESPAYVNRTARFRPAIKAFRVGPRFRLSALRPYRKFVKAFLLDGKVAGLRGGTGMQFDWAIAKKARKFGAVFLAGGLKPENVREAILAAVPDFVDVASGVETRPGKKDAAKLRMFFGEVESARRILSRKKK